MAQAHGRLHPVCYSCPAPAGLPGCCVLRQGPQRSRQAYSAAFQGVRPAAQPPARSPPPPLPAAATAIERFNHFMLQGRSMRVMLRVRVPLSKMAGQGNLFVRVRGRCGPPALGPTPPPPSKPFPRYLGLGSEPSLAGHVFAAAALPHTALSSSGCLWCLLPWPSLIERQLCGKSCRHRGACRCGISRMCTLVVHPPPPLFHNAAHPLSAPHPRRAFTPLWTTGCWSRRSACLGGCSPPRWWWTMRGTAEGECRSRDGPGNKN